MDNTTQNKSTGLSHEELIELKAYAQSAGMEDDRFLDMLNLSKYELLRNEIEINTRLRDLSKNLEDTIDKIKQDRSGNPNIILESLAGIMKGSAEVKRMSEPKPVSLELYEDMSKDFDYEGINFEESDGGYKSHVAELISSTIQKECMLRIDTPSINCDEIKIDIKLVGGDAVKGCATEFKVKESLREETHIAVAVLVNRVNEM